MLSLVLLLSVGEVKSHFIYGRETPLTLMSVITIKAAVSGQYEDADDDDAFTFEKFNIFPHAFVVLILVDVLGTSGCDDTLG